MAPHHTSPQSAARRTSTATAQQRVRSEVRPPPAPPENEQEGDSIGESVLAALPRLQRQAQLQLNGQRRAVRRVDLVASVALRSESGTREGLSTNICAGGIFIATVDASPVGTRVQLTLTIPGGAQIEVEGEVRWVRALSEAQPGLLSGEGLAFTAISPEVLRAIEAFVAERASLFFPDG